MKVLITGAGGQLGQELQLSAPSHLGVFPLERNQLDVTQAEEVDNILGDLQPQVVINAAAYTAVDRAEEEKERALAVNADGARNLARAATDVSARLIQVSTDFVFDGASSRPYPTDARPNPQSVYGATKRQGERYVLEVADCRVLVIRTAWVYSRFGHNFVKTMLKLMDKKEQIDIVADQVGTPTWAKGLAAAIWKAVDSPELRGILHWTDAGVASWYDFAVAIQDEARKLGLLQSPCEILPTTAADFPTVAYRPPFSVLDKTATWRQLRTVAPHWRRQLQLMLRELEEYGDG